jgi:hypothetical protein
MASRYVRDCAPQFNSNPVHASDLLAFVTLVLFVASVIVAAAALSS